MTDFIRTECPNCHTQYQIGLNQMSTGRSKAKCGRCGTSFSIKDNIISQSLLQETHKAEQSKQAQKAKSTIHTTTHTKAPTQQKDVSASNKSLANSQSESLFETPPSQQSKPSTLASADSKSGSDGIINKQKSVESKLDKAVQQTAISPLSNKIADTTKSIPTQRSSTQSSSKKPASTTQSVANTKAQPLSTEEVFGEEWDTNKTVENKSIEKDLSTAKPASSNVAALKPSALKPSALKPKLSSADDKTSTADTSTSKQNISAVSTSPNTRKKSSLTEVDKTNVRKADEKQKEAEQDDDLLFHDDMDGADDTLDKNSKSASDEDWIFDEALINAKQSVEPLSETTQEKADGDAWLEDLLSNEQKPNKNDDIEVADTNVDTDLSALLDDLGVESTEPTSPSPDIARNKANKRLKSKPKRSLNTGSMVASFLWLIGCIILSFLLLAQYAVFNLDNLVKNPEHRATLQSFCDVVTCALPNAEISNISIVNQSHKNSQVTTGATDILASVSNQSTTDQLYPNLKVEIYGAEGIIGDFVATPDEYLLTSHSVIGPTRSAQFMLTVDISTNNISEIKITPFY